MRSKVLADWVAAGDVVAAYFAAAMDAAVREGGEAGNAHARRVLTAWRTWQAEQVLDPAQVMGLRAWVTNRALAAPPAVRSRARAERDAVMAFLAARSGT